MSKLPPIILWVTIPLYVIDQITKWLIVANFPEPRPGRGGSDKVVVVIEDFFNLVRVHNQGVAFGMANGTVWAPFVFLVVATVALTALVIFWRRGAFDTLLMKLAGALLAAGICGNLTDRLVQGFFLESTKGEGFFSRLTSGYVVDFLDFKLPLYAKLVPKSEGHWPSFNVADSCICIAAFFLILSTFRDAKVSEDEKAGDDKPATAKTSKEQEKA